MSDYSIRRQGRLRREYLYRKSLEQRRAATQQRKEKIKQSIQDGKDVPNHLQSKAIGLMEAGEWDDEGPRLAAELGGEVADIDDEYRWAGVEDPKIVLTTSRSPSSKLRQFAKELKLLFPNCQRINRGSSDHKELLEACRKNDVTDFIIVHETRGKPDGLIISHLPYGPTARFTLEDVVMRHDIPGIGTMSEEYPKLAIHNFKSKLGERVMTILRCLFPVPKETSKRVVSFSNCEDWILLRQHTMKDIEGGRDCELTELGPRFSMFLYKLSRGTLDEEGDIEFVYKPYKNTERKKRYLSLENPW